MLTPFLPALPGPSPPYRSCPGTDLPGGGENREQECLLLLLSLRGPEVGKQGARERPTVGPPGSSASGVVDQPTVAVTQKVGTWTGVTVRTSCPPSHIIPIILLVVMSFSYHEKNREQKSLEPLLLAEPHLVYR